MFVIYYTAAHHILQHLSTNKFRSGAEHTFRSGAEHTTSLTHFQKHTHTHTHTHTQTHTHTHTHAHTHTTHTHTHLCLFSLLKDMRYTTR